MSGSHAGGAPAAGEDAATGWTVTVLTEREAARRTGSRDLPPARPLVPGRPLVLGRQGDLLVGADDTLVSRRALTIEIDDGRWKLQILNGRGAHVHPWRRRSFPVRGAPEVAGYHEILRAERVGVRILGSPDLLHWVLLESAAPDGPAPVSTAGPGRTGPGRTGSGSAGLEPAGPGPAGHEPTTTEAAPDQLTLKQLEALRTVFEPQLAWPPSPQPPFQLQQASNRMGGLGVGAIQDRLEGARKKARRLGLPRNVEILDPEMLYLLVEAGYLDT